MNNDAYIFFDIDGTIYSPILGIPESTREAIDKLKKNGHHPVLCTGRTKVMIFPAIMELGFDGIVAGVGAYGQWQEKVLFNECLPEDETEKLVSDFKKYGFNPYPEGTDHVFFDPEVNKNPAGELKRVFSLAGDDILKPYQKGASGISKVSAVFKEGCDLKSFKKTLNGKYFAVNHYNILMETFPVGTTKGSGIRKLADHLGINTERTFAFGDSFNDLEMLETVKYGVCMENGDPKLLERISLHAKRMEEDGIYHSLKEFGLI